MKKLLTVVGLAFCSLAWATQDSFELLEKKALNGDYQAQRNLAYTLSNGLPRNVILGCAWRIVILESGNSAVDESDVSNKQYYCDKKLDSDGLRASQAQAIKLMVRVKHKK